MLCIRDDWTNYRFVFYVSWVAFDVTTILASGLHPARFSASDVTAPLSRGPHLARFSTEKEVQFHAFRRLKRSEKKGFEEKSFHFEISIPLSYDLANKKKSVIYTLSFDANGAIFFYVTVATLISSHVKITCYFHV